MTGASAARRPHVPAAGDREAFHAAARARGFMLDAAQEASLAHWCRMLEDLRRPAPRVLGLLARRRRPPRGLYVWGSVGRGKSFLMDEFFRLAAPRHKRRVHFHRFMQEVHAGLRAVAGQPEPLRLVAQAVAREAQLLCLDEMQITDIGDAMLMRGLLEGLFERGVAVVTTSNEPPDGLYRDGLQRSQFLPAIALMQQHLEVVHLDAGRDYRLAALSQAGVWHQPLGAAAHAALQAAFGGLAGDDLGPGTLTVEGRALPAVRLGERAVWFDFATLCGGPRGTADYIALARAYPAVLLEGVPQFGVTDAESMRRFTWLVDEFYDRHVKLLVAAAVPVDALYARVAPALDRQRTHSRLVEMQGPEYLARAHLG